MNFAATKLWLSIVTVALAAATPPSPRLPKRLARLRRLRARANSAQRVKKHETAKRETKFYLVFLKAPSLASFFESWGPTLSEMSAIGF